MKNRINTARIAIAAIVLYHVLLFGLIFIRPDLDPSWHTISEWAIGPYGWIMSITFIVASVSYASLFIAIKSYISGLIGYIGIALLLICTIGLVGVGIFTTDPLTTPQDQITTTGLLHMFSGMAQLMLLPFSALLINISLIRNPEWTFVRKSLVWTAGLPFLGFIGFIVHLSIYIIPLGENAYGPGVPIGWPPRFLFLTYMVWLVTLAWQTIREEKKSFSPSLNPSFG